MEYYCFKALCPGGEERTCKYLLYIVVDLTERVLKAVKASPKRIICIDSRERIVLVVNKRSLEYFLIGDSDAVSAARLLVHEILNIILQHR